jgi:hypothetical protein
MNEEIKMNCPYCNSEMQKGYINSSYALARWYADGEKPKMNPKNSVIKLSNSPATKLQVIESHYCGDCAKIVIDIPNKH